MEQEILFFKELILCNNQGLKFRDFDFNFPGSDPNRKLKILRRLSSRYGIYSVKLGNKDYLDPLTSLDIGLPLPPTSARYYKSYQCQDVKRPLKKLQRENLYDSLGLRTGVPGSSTSEITVNDDLTTMFPSLNPATIVQTPDQQFALQEFVGNFHLFPELPELQQLEIQQYLDNPPQQQDNLFPFPFPFPSDFDLTSLNPLIPFPFPDFTNTLIPFPFPIDADFDVTSLNPLIPFPFPPNYPIDICQELLEIRHKSECVYTSKYIDYVNNIPSPVPHLLLDSKFYLITNYIIMEYENINFRQLSALDFKIIHTLFLESDCNPVIKEKISKGFAFFDNFVEAKFAEKWQLYVSLHDLIDDSRLASVDLNNLLNKICHSP